ncbi:hypothetical protein JNW88_02345 [Micromonospora sp. ATA32]|nr:hypothetical protein [Micromonospora sp. ATA32]
MPVRVKKSWWASHSRVRRSVASPHFDTTCTWSPNTSSTRAASASNAPSTGGVRR